MPVSRALTDVLWLLRLTQSLHCFMNTPSRNLTSSLRASARVDVQPEGRLDWCHNWHVLFEMLIFLHNLSGGFPDFSHHLISLRADTCKAGYTPAQRWTKIKNENKRR